MRALPTALLLLAACSSVSTSYDFDPDADFARLKAYAWVESAIDRDTDPLVLERVRRATDAGLAAAGYRKVESGGDFHVAAHLRSRQRVQVRDTGYAGPYYGYGYGHWGTRRIDVYEYDEGSIILDVIDAKTNKLLWRGIAKAAVPESPKPEELTKLVDEAVSKLLEDFPPPAR